MSFEVSGGLKKHFVHTSTVLVDFLYRAAAQPVGGFCFLPSDRRIFRPAVLVARSCCTCTYLVVSVLPFTCPGHTGDTDKPPGHRNLGTYLILTYPTCQSTLPFFLPCSLSTPVVLPLLDTTDFAVSRSLPLPYRYIADFPVPWTWTCRRAAARRRCNLKLSSSSSKESRRSRRRLVRPVLLLRLRHPLAE